jgi:hypothetical protein
MHCITISQDQRCRSRPFQGFKELAQGWSRPDRTPWLALFWPGQPPMGRLHISSLVRHSSSDKGKYLKPYSSCERVNLVATVANALPSTACRRRCDRAARLLLNALPDSCRNEGVRCIQLPRRDNATRYTQMMNRTATPYQTSCRPPCRYPARGNSSARPCTSLTQNFHFPRRPARVVDTYFRTTVLAALFLGAY